MANDGVHPFLGMRCSIHNVDEPRDDDTFQVCFECNHVYQTEQDLLDSHNADLVLYGEEPRSELGFLRFFCGECVHDF